MTIEKKQAKLFNYCYEHMCSDCKLNDSALNWSVTCAGMSCLRIDYSPEKDLDEALRIIGVDNANECDPDIKNNTIKPSYYNDSKITPFDVIDDWGLDFYLGNAVKYIKRAGKKDGNSRLQDLQKIRTYVDEEIKREETSGE